MIDLRHGDCLDVMKELEDDSVDCLITSPPYNVGKEYEYRITLDEYKNWMTRVIQECHRVLSDNGSICWQVGSFIDKKQREVFPLDILFYNSFKDLGMVLRNRIIWHYGHGLHCKKRLSGRYETVLWFTKSNEYTFNLDDIRVPQKYPNKKAYKGPNKGKVSSNPLGKNPSDVWEITNINHNKKEKTDHPCQFPEELVKRLVLMTTNKNDLVLDPFVGSGTTAVVCQRHNRSCIGIDNNEKYLQAAKERITLVE
jgi:adenine-specific DNA-methyltransferase